jgi:D-serine deaminase-like pyridoxal phosphate-dependent protein
VVSGGGTPHAFHADAHAGLTEMRAGTYLLGDRTCVADDSVARSDCALRIVATVVARPARDRVIVDAGSKALSSDPVEVPGVPGFGEIDGSPDAALYALSEEHGHVRVPAASRLRVGERIAILPNHCCGAMNMHDTFLATSTALEAPEPWPVDARGCVR